MKISEAAKRASNKDKLRLEGNAICAANDIESACSKAIGCPERDYCFQVAMRYQQAINEDTAEKDAEIARMRAALTPSAETKAAYMGEFWIPLPDRDEDGEECMRRINVPWTVTKKIMAAIRKQALAGGEGEG